MDVFGRLNNFLDKDDDFAPKYDLDDTTPDSSVKSLVDHTESESSHTEDEEMIEVPKKPAGRRGRKRNAVSSEIDLTAEPVLASPSKSRRRIADELKAVLIEAEIDLSGTPDTTASQEADTPAPKGRGRGRKAKVPKNAPKPRRVSYRRALAVTNAQIPELNTQSRAEEDEVSDESSQEIAPAPTMTVRSNTVDDAAIDLTGDVVLQEGKHVSAPLFTQSHSPRKTRRSQEQAKKKISLGLGDLDFDIDAVTIHIKINGKLEKHDHGADVQFFELLKVIAENYKTQVSNVLLFNEKDKKILPEQTPNQIGHKLSSIYTCRLVESSNDKIKVDKANLIKLKFQSDKWKKPIEIKASKLDSMQSWLTILCEKDGANKFKPSQFSISYDGDKLDLSKAPFELELEGDELIDCRIKI